MTSSRILRSKEGPAHVVVAPSAKHSIITYSRRIRISSHYPTKYASIDDGVLSLCRFIQRFKTNGGHEFDFPFLRKFHNLGISYLKQGLGRSYSRPTFDPTKLNSKGKDFGANESFTNI